MLASDFGNALWRKSSYSGQGGDCVAIADCVLVPGAGISWRKSSHFGAQSECVEMAGGVTGVVPVRDSKDPEGPVLLFPADAWSSFLAGVKGGEFPVG
ncbi:DUF397 domain-containing protein [Streptomyces sp. NRRL S-350]|uniref:DUF397 domain-containing protein n=1 Tax=Streptomyces sp. NRRL S-350 TaxID=1463902 RepID=UPI0004BEA4DB|nr:DUF397 domain-containing protein [Streptomyces sp. NRRL S-350]